MGKTRLISALVARLDRVVFLKWTHHPLGEDKPFSDTARLGSLGYPTVLIAPDGLVMRPTLSEDTLFAILPTLYPKASYILIEGNKTGRWPKIYLGDPPAEGPERIWLAIGPNPPKDQHVAWCRTGLPLGEATLTHVVETILGRMTDLPDLVDHARHAPDP